MTSSDEARTSPAPRRHRRTRTDRSSVAGDEARARILGIAFALMAEKGYRGTSIAQVAARAGISQSGLLHHFPTKQDLLIAVIDHRRELDTRLLEDADGEALLGWAAFDGLLELVRHNAAHPQLVRMFVTLSAEALDPEHPAHGWIRHHYSDTERTLTTAIEAGVADQTMRSDVPAATVARLTVAVMDGLQLQWLAGHGELDMVADFADHVSQLRRIWGRTAPIPDVASL